MRDIRLPLGRVSSTASQAYAQSPGGHVINEYIKINKETNYKGTTATIADLNSGALLMFTIGNNGVGLGGKFTLSTRVRFVDH